MPKIDERARENFECDIEEMLVYLLSDKHAGMLSIRR